MADAAVLIDEAAWLNDLPPQLGEHRRLLEGLLSAVRTDPRVRALQVQGSIGRGEGDHRSDLDVGMVVSDGAWPAIAQDVADLVARLAPIVDEHAEFLPNSGAPDVLRVWAQFASEVQLDLLVLPEVHLLGSGPDGRTLHDPDGLLIRTDHPMRLTSPSSISKWTFLCWHNLAEVVKNVERERFAAAAEWLGSARLATISCWAAAHDAEYSGLAIVVAARLGVSSPWLEGVEKTYPLPERASVLAAAISLARLQKGVEELLWQRFQLAPRPLGVWVTDRLEALAKAPAGGKKPPARSSRRDRGTPASRPRPRRRAARRPR